MGSLHKQSFQSHRRVDKIHLVTLGCPKNEVDSEIMCASLQGEGFGCVRDPSLADVIILNTCGFIQEAVEESLDAVLELSKNKLSGRCRHLVMTGCMVQRYGHKLVHMLPEVDLLIGPKLACAVGVILAGHIKGGSLKRIFIEPAELHTLDSQPPMTSQRVSPGISAFLKVSEGCSNHCSYCTIPSIRGTLRSRPEKEILAEARVLVAGGTLELNLIAQDLTAYGHDRARDKRNALSRLLKKIARIEPLRWIRLLYCHPAHIEEGVIELFGEEEKLCPYVDIPLQHVSRTVLAAMKRPYSEDTLRRLIERLRAMRPDIALRTTVMVGYPGETEDDFQQLLGFLKDIGFHHVGAFCYSQEQGTQASHQANALPEAEKTRRYKAVMDLQAGISMEKTREMVGTLQEVLIEGHHDETPLLLQGRTRYQAPQVDGIVCINKGHIPRPGIALVRITDAHIYDLVGEIVPS